MEDLLETLRINEEIAQKFYEIEISILSILNFRDLFEKLLTEIRDRITSYNVCYTKLLRF